jgi:hypothetical protein
MLLSYYIFTFFSEQGFGIHGWMGKPFGIGPQDLPFAQVYGGYPIGYNGNTASNDVTFNNINPGAGGYTQLK